MHGCRPCCHCADPLSALASVVHTASAAAVRAPAACAVLGQRACRQSSSIRTCSLAPRSFAQVPLAVCIRSVQAGIYPNVFQAARAIVAAAGVRGLFTGFLPTVLEDVPDMAGKCQGRVWSCRLRFSCLECCLAQWCPRCWSTLWTWRARPTRLGRPLLRPTVTGRHIALAWSATLSCQLLPALLTLLPPHFPPCSQVCCVRDDAGAAFESEWRTPRLCSRRPGHGWRGG